MGLLSLVCVACCLPLTSSIIDTKTWDADGSILALMNYSRREGKLVLSEDGILTNLTNGILNLVAKSSLFL